MNKHKLTLLIDAAMMAVLAFIVWLMFKIVPLIEAQTIDCSTVLV